MKFSTWRSVIKNPEKRVIGLVSLFEVVQEFLQRYTRNVDMGQPAGS